jgi:hypothetical protein
LSGGNHRSGCTEVDAEACTICIHYYMVFWCLVPEAIIPNGKEADEGLLITGPMTGLSSPIINITLDPITLFTAIWQCLIENCRSLNMD